jgi:hypothetical protein
LGPFTAQQSGLRIIDATHLTLTSDTSKILKVTMHAFTLIEDIKLNNSNSNHYGNGIP